MRTKADFKALRDALGLSQQDVADACEVRLTTVKRWERPGFPEPPEDAWEYLGSESERHDDMVESSIGKVHDLVDEYGTSFVVSMTYYRDQPQYDALGRDPGTFTFANSVAREVALRLADEGIEVEFRYPDDGAVRTPGSRY